MLIDALPSGRTFASAEHTAKGRTITGKLKARTSDGTEELYFVNIAFGETGRILFHGEFESSKVIHGIIKPGPAHLLLPVRIRWHERHLRSSQGPAESTSQLAQLRKSKLNAQPQVRVSNSDLRGLHGEVPPGRAGGRVQ